jgi:hypothetical protein
MSGSKRPADNRYRSTAGRQRIAPGSSYRQDNLANAWRRCSRRGRIDIERLSRAENGEARRRIPAGKLPFNFASVWKRDPQVVIAAYRSGRGDDGVRTVHDAARGAPGAAYLNDCRRARGSQIGERRREFVESSSCHAGSLARMRGCADHPNGESHLERAIPVITLEHLFFP